MKSTVIKALLFAILLLPILACGQEYRVLSVLKHEGSFQIASKIQLDKDNVVTVPFTIPINTQYIYYLVVSHNDDKPTAAYQLERKVFFNLATNNSLEEIPATLPKTKSGQPVTIELLQDGIPITRASKQNFIGGIVGVPMKDIFSPTRLQLRINNTSTEDQIWLHVEIVAVAPM